VTIGIGTGAEYRRPPAGMSTDHPLINPKLNGVTATGEYTALVCAWAGGWEVFVLDPREGLLGRTETVTLGEVETAARGFLAARFRRAASDFRVAVVRS
jgi:hypothetical protein